MTKIPKDDDWRDHATPCPNCKQPVLHEDEHYHPDTMIDPSWYSCDAPDKPTIAELEAILDEEPESIEIQPDGSVKTVKGEPHHAKPKILTLRQVLGGTY